MCLFLHVAHPARLLVWCFLILSLGVALSLTLGGMGVRCLRANWKWDVCMRQEQCKRPKAVSGVRLLPVYTALIGLGPFDNARGST